MAHGGPALAWGSNVGMDVAPLKLVFAIACSSWPANQTWAPRLIYASLESNPNPITEAHYEEVLTFLYPDGTSPENVTALLSARKGSFVRR